MLIFIMSYDPQTSMSKENISLRFSRNSEADASEFLENLKIAISSWPTN